MDHRERFYLTIGRESVDHPASWLGLPSAEAGAALMRYFSVNGMNEVKRLLEDDIQPFLRPRELGIRSFGQVRCDDLRLESTGVLTELDLDSIRRYEWPEPDDYICADFCKAAIEAIPKEYASLAILWSSHYHVALKLLGAEVALVKMIEEPEVFKEVLDRTNEIFMKVNDGVFSATKGRLDAVMYGNDMGTQRGLMISPAHIREFLLPGIKAQIDHAHSYGLKVIFHSCGAISEIIPDLVQVGADAIHPMQTSARGMSHSLLKGLYGDKISFCGGIDVQHLLVSGEPTDVRHRVAELKDLFPSGLIFSPSHEVILPDVPVRNIEALFDEVRV